MTTPTKPAKPGFYWYKESERFASWKRIKPPDPDYPNATFEEKE